MPRSPLTVDVSYSKLTSEPIARQVWADERGSCILDVDAEDRLVGVEIIGNCTLVEVLPLIFAKARFPKET